MIKTMLATVAILVASVLVADAGWKTSKATAPSAKPLANCQKNPAFINERITVEP